MSATFEWQVFYLDITWYGIECSFPLDFICCNIWNTHQINCKNAESYTSRVNNKHKFHSRNRNRHTTWSLVASLAGSSLESWVSLCRKLAASNSTFCEDAISSKLHNQKETPWHLSQLAMTLWPNNSAQKQDNYDAQQWPGKPIQVLYTWNPPYKYT